MSKKKEKETKAPPINVRGTKVALGPYLPEHAEIFVAFKQDPEVTIYSDSTFTIPLFEEEKEALDGISKRGAAFTIYELEKLSIIGGVGLRSLNHRNGTAILGISIGNKDYWGKGYGTEALKLVLDYGFRFLNLYNIGLDTTSFNLRGIRAYEKAGFKEIGRRRGAVLMNGKRYDEVLMDCIASEFTPPVPGWPTIEG